MMEIRYIYLNMCCEDIFQTILLYRVEAKTNSKLTELIDSQQKTNLFEKDYKVMPEDDLFCKLFFFIIH